MAKIKGALSGKKTYVTALLGILAAIGGVLTGELEITQALQVGWNALLAVFIRHGIATK